MERHRHVTKGAVARKMAGEGSLHRLVSLQRLALEVLGTLNDALALPDALGRIMGAIKRETGFDAVAIRLGEDNDFPYFAQHGFSRDFLLNKNVLIARDAAGNVCRDAEGNICLECTCGLVISGQTDPANPLFTKRGSAWTNDTSRSLDAPAGRGPKVHAPDRCIHEGYRSVALVPIRANKEIVGLLQLNDRRKDRLTLELVEFLERISDSIGVVLMRKRAEESLRKNEEKHRILFDSAGDAIFVHDEQLRMLAVNRQACQRLGYSQAELMSLVVGQVDSPAEAPHAVERLALVKEHGQLTFETSHRHKDGSLIATEVNAQRITWDGQPAVMSICRDITERKRTEQQLSEKNVLLSESQRIGHIGTWIWEPPEDEVRWSDEAFRIFRVSPESFVPGITSLLSLIHPDDRAAMREWIRACQAGEQPRELEFRIIPPDGNVRTLSGRGEFLPATASAPARMMGTVQDITERKGVEAAMCAAKEAAEAAIQVKDQFLAKLSHELRTPLTPVLLATSQWQAKPDLPAAVRDDMEMVCRNLELEGRLLDDLLDVNRILYGKLSLRREVVSVHQAISQALGIVASAVQAKQLQLTVQLQAANDRVHGDAARVQQILWNLLSNAIKFTPESGRIAVGTADEANGQIRVQITDSGIGIEPDSLSELFKPFEQGNQQINRQYGGLGLGLSICKSMVEAHGGIISVASEGRGKGATFTLHFPLAEAPAAAAPAPLVRQPRIGDRTLGIGDRHLRILLVEDHTDTARMLSRLLRGEGHVVETAGDVASALDRVKRSDFDLMVSDLGLPDGSGHDLMRQLVARGRPLKAIAVSGYGTEDDLRKSQEAGFAEHLVKPVKPAQLLEMIERVASLPIPEAGVVHNHGQRPWI